MAKPSRFRKSYSHSGNGIITTLSQESLNPVNKPLRFVQSCFGLLTGWLDHKIIIARLARIHCIAIELAVLRLDQARLDELGAKLGYDAGLQRLCTLARASR